MSVYFPDLKMQSKEVKELLDNLKAFPTDYKKMLVRSLNRAGKGVETDSAKLVVSRYRIKQAKVKKSFKQTKANFSTLEVREKATFSKALNLIEYGAKQTKKGVSVKILKSGKRHLIKHAFINKGKKSGKLLVFKRTSKERNSIEALYVTSGLDILKDKAYQKQLQMGAQERLLKNMQSEAEYRLSKLAQ